MSWIRKDAVIRKNKKNDTYEFFIPLHYYCKTFLYMFKGYIRYTLKELFDQYKIDIHYMCDNKIEDMLLAGNKFTLTSKYGLLFTFPKDSLITDVRLCKEKIIECVKNYIDSHREWSSIFSRTNNVLFYVGLMKRFFDFYISHSDSYESIDNPPIDALYTEILKTTDKNIELIPLDKDNRVFEFQDARETWENELFCNYSLQVDLCKFGTYDTVDLILNLMDTRLYGVNIYNHDINKLKNIVFHKDTNENNKKEGSVIFVLIKEYGKVYSQTHTLLSKHEDTKYLYLPTDVNYYDTWASRFFGYNNYHPNVEFKLTTEKKDELGKLGGWLNEHDIYYYTENTVFDVNWYADFVGVRLPKMHLTQLPLNPEKWPNLTELDLRGNFFTSFPKKLHDFPKLKKINLDGNHLHDLQGLEENDTITHLYIKNNLFSVFPKDVWKCTNLSHLGLGNNFITFISKDDLYKCKDLKGINLRNNNYLKIYLHLKDRLDVERELKKRFKKSRDIYNEFSFLWS